MAASYILTYILPSEPILNRRASILATGFFLLSQTQGPTSKQAKHTPDLN